MLGRLKAGPDLNLAAPTPSLDLISMTALEALYADRIRSPEAPALAARLDTLMENTDYSSFSSGRLAFAALTAGRLLEKYQNPAAGLRAVRRRSTWWSNDMPYLAAQLREEGRLAALAGQKQEAIESYRHYLSLRSAPEPKVQPEVDGVKKELAKLESARTE